MTNEYKTLAELGAEHDCPFTAHKDGVGKVTITHMGKKKAFGHHDGGEESTWTASSPTWEFFVEPEPEVIYFQWAVINNTRDVSITGPSTHGQVEERYKSFVKFGPGIRRVGNTLELVEK